MVRYDIFAAVKIQVFILVAMPHGVALGYQHFGGPCCLHFQGPPQHCTVSEPRRPQFEDGTKVSICFVCLWIKYDYVISDLIYIIVWEI